ncbi:hypothetical protein V3C99_008050 [Haemonchus contortus]
MLLAVLHWLLFSLIDGQAEVPQKCIIIEKKERLIAPNCGIFSNKSLVKCGSEAADDYGNKGECIQKRDEIICSCEGQCEDFMTVEKRPRFLWDACYQYDESILPRPVTVPSFEEHIKNISTNTSARTSYGTSSARTSYETSSAPTSYETSSARTRYGSDRTTYFRNPEFIEKIYIEEDWELYSQLEPGEGKNLQDALALNVHLSDHFTSRMQMELFELPTFLLMSVILFWIFVCGLILLKSLHFSTMVIMGIPLDEE